MNGLGHLTYVILEGGWAAPVILLQWAVGWKALWARRRALLMAVFLATAYLSCTDAVAIASGIWTLHDSHILGLRLGDLPLEEILFFLLTNTMVAQTVALVDDRLPGLRVRLIDWSWIR